MDMGYRIWDAVYGLWIRSKKPENLTESEAPTIILYTIKCTFSCKVRAISKSNKHHIHLDMYLGQIGYSILDIVPSCVNRV